MCPETDIRLTAVKRSYRYDEKKPINNIDQGRKPPVEIQHIVKGSSCTDIIALFFLVRSLIC